jgi:hypothetical protein
MKLPSIKDLIKDNIVKISRYKSGNLFYKIFYFDRSMLDFHSAHRAFEFPVPIADVGEAELKESDKAIYFMRYINWAIRDGTFIEL